MKMVTRNLKAGALTLATAIGASALFGTAPHASASEYVCPQATVVFDKRLNGFARFRAGSQIAVNDLSGGLGLSGATKLWLFKRQCHLAGLGVSEFSTLQHRAADCAAFTALKERYAGQSHAIQAVERDVQRTDFWNDAASLGQPRPVFAGGCR